MDSKEIKVFERIIEHVHSIIEETQDINDAEEFNATNDKSKAALFDLLQIGELIQNGLSKETIQQIDTIPWRQIYALSKK